MGASILKVLTELTALSSNGITILKPFRPWFGIPLWRGRTVGLRLLNAGEIEQSLEFINTAATTAQDQALKKEIVSRSLWTIDGSYVVSKEELEQYNRDHRSELSDLEYKRIFVNGFEQYLVDFLYSMYNELQQKQTRLVLGINMCAVCRDTELTIPPTARKLKFSVAEYVCGDCLTTVTDKDGFEFEEKTIVPEPTAEQTVVSQPVPKARTLTPADFPTLEAYQNHLVDLAEQNEQSSQKV